MKIFLSIIVLFLSFSTQASPWAGPAKVKYVRTFDGESISIGLEDVQCPNAKDYFLVEGLARNETFLSIVLAAYMGGKKVRISYDTSIDDTHCYVKGIWLEE